MNSETSLQPHLQKVVEEDTYSINLEIETTASKLVILPIECKNQENKGIPCPRVWLVPVKSIVAGQEPVLLHDSLGKSENGKKSACTARYSGAGTCNKGGHSGGLGIGQLAAWSRVEYSIPQTSSHLPSPLVSIQVQPHLFEGLSNSLFTIVCIRTSNAQSKTGNKISRMFDLIFRFCIQN